MAALQTWAEIVAASMISDKSIRESLQDAVYNVSPMETPILSRIQQAKVEGMYVEWQIDTYRAAAANAWLEDIAYTAKDLTPPTRAQAITQIFYDGASVTDRARAIQRAGTGDPFVYHEGKRVIEMKKDMELALVKGSAVTGTTGTANNMGGIMNVASTNKTSLSGITLTETIFNNLLELVWTNSVVQPNEVYVGAKLKRTISLFSTKVTSFQPASDRNKNLTIDTYDSDFGSVKVFLHRNLTSHGTTSSNQMFVIDPAWLATGWLRPLRREVLSRDGTRDRFQISAELTLLYRNQATLLVADLVQANIA